MKVSYEWLQTFFDEGACPSIKEIEQKLTFHAFEIEGVEEVNGDSVIDVDVLPNRAADSLSHRGIAREISALFEIPMKRDQLREEVLLEPETNSVEVTLDSKASCSYYIAAHITGVEVKESPGWLRARLEAIGQKSINNVVDATNYVLFELGRPTHVFDAKKFEGDVPNVGTRLAREGEKITLLGGDEVALTDSMTLIVDANSDAPVAVGGVKGGAHAEVDENTTDIIIETANFHPTQTRLTSQALKMRTDASARFENHMADKLADYGVVAVVELILKIAGGELVGYKSAGELDAGNTEVKVSAERVSKLLGAKINEDEIESILTRLQFEYSRDGENFTVKAPFERRDVNLPEDVIEEIGRVYGYEKIESAQLPTPEREVGVHKKYAYSELIRNTLTALGATEVYLYALRDSGEIKLRNALASDKDHLRGDLASGIKDSLDKNERKMPLLGKYDAIQIFEIGNVFLKDTAKTIEDSSPRPHEGFREETHVCIGARVSGTKKKEERTIAILKETKTKLEEVLGGALPEISGEILEFNLDEFVKELPEIAYPEVATVTDSAVYQAISQYPFVSRDIAVWVPEGTKIKEIKEIVQTHAGELLKRNDQFDEFEKDGRVSYAFHLVFQSMEETLTDEKIGEIMSVIEEEMSAKEGWEIR